MSAKVYEKVTNEIIKALERGAVPWDRPWRDTAGPRNVESGRAYRGINVWLLSLSPYESPWWVTYKGAQRLGGHVRQGERHTLVTLWKRIRVRDEQADDPDAKKTIFLLRYYRVFNIEQCEGIEPPAQETPEPVEPLAACEALLDGMPQRPTIEHGGNRACYWPALDRVDLPARTAFTSIESYYSTAFHELVHSTGHESRLARPDLLAARGFGSEPYSREELTAEMGAALLCGVSGIAPATVERSASYLRSWIDVLRGDHRLVVSAAARAQRAADFIRGVEPASDADANDENTDGDRDGAEQRTAALAVAA